MATPADRGLYMPAEWQAHDRCWMAWPCRVELWGEHLEAAREAYAEVARAILGFEPVTMIANPEYRIYHCFLRDPDGYQIEIQRFDDPAWPAPG